MKKIILVSLIALTGLSLTSFVHKKEKELNVRLNKNQAGWDFEILNNEFLNIELINWGFNSLEIPSLEDLNIAANEKEFDENIKTDMQCPSCGYKYS